MTAAAMTRELESSEGMGTRGAVAGGDLATSIRVLLEAEQAVDQAKAEIAAAREKWGQAMATLNLAQQAVAMDMPNGPEPVTLRISVTHVATVARAGRGVTVTRSRVIAGRS